MGGGVCAIGFGEGTGGTKVEDAVNRALDNQLLDIEDISVARGALVHVEGGEDMTLEEVNRAGELVLESVNKDARGVWGSKINSALDNRIRATVVLAGVESPFLMSEKKSVTVTTPKTVQKEPPKTSKKVSVKKKA
jgi:cell division protein FtsZ